MPTGAVRVSRGLSGGGSAERHTTMTETLSGESRLSASSHSSRAAAAGSLCLLNARRAKSIALCELKTSHSPSHAITTNSSAPRSVHRSTSGSTVSGPGASRVPLSPSM